MNQIKLKRIASDIQHNLSIICGVEARDELLKTITITGVEVTNDLSLARVYFTSTKELDKKIIEKDLNDETSSYLRTELASKIDVRHTPKIRFIYDNSIEYGTNIEKKLKEIHEKESKKNTSIEN